MNNNCEKSPHNISLVLYIFPLSFYLLHWNDLQCTFLLNTNTAATHKALYLFQHQVQLFEKWTVFQLKKLSKEIRG